MSIRTDLIIALLATAAACSSRESALLSDETSKTTASGKKLASEKDPDAAEDNVALPIEAEITSGMQHPDVKVALLGEMLDRMLARESNFRRENYASEFASKPLTRIDPVKLAREWYGIEGVIRASDALALFEQTDLGADGFLVRPNESATGSAAE
jgi:hypothetical protein